MVYLLLFMLGVLVTLLGLRYLSEKNPELVHILLSSKKEDVKMLSQSHHVGRYGKQSLTGGEIAEVPLKDVR